MDIRETAKIMAILETAYPAFYRNLPDDDLDAVISLWQELFSEEPYALVAAAVKALISTKVEGYPPTIGAVKEQITKLTRSEHLSELDAWSLVCKACQNGSYGYREEFSKLPEVVQQAVGSADQIRIWAQMDETTVNSVVASNFMRTFREKQKQQKELAMLPESVRGLISAASETLKMDKPTDKGRLVAAKLERLTAPGGLAKSARPFPEEEYNAPDDEEWEKMRDRALARLNNREVAV